MRHTWDSKRLESHFTMGDSEHYANPLRAHSILKPLRAFTETMEERDLPDGNCVVFDCGGGTTDITVVRVMTKSKAAGTFSLSNAVPVTIVSAGWISPLPEDVAELIMSALASSAISRGPQRQIQRRQRGQVLVASTVGGALSRIDLLLTGPIDQC